MDRTYTADEVKEIIETRKVREDPPVYDLRGLRSIKADYGETLYSGEIVAYALGLRRGWHSDERNDTRVSSIQWYFDARDPRNAADFDECLGRLITRFGEALLEWERAGRNLARPGEGGGVYYRPVAIAVSNYGGGVIADDRTARVMRLPSVREG